MLSEFDPAWIADLRTVAVSRCCVTKLFHYSDERNTWQWSTSRSFPGSEAFKQAIDGARADVERRRVQGSRWWIREVPALVLGGAEYTVLLAPRNALRPFSACSRLELNSASIGGWPSNCSAPCPTIYSSPIETSATQSFRFVRSRHDLAEPESGWHGI
jgi:hypothetical protein